MKQCSKCKLEKSEFEFSFSNSTKDGLHSVCKECANRYQAKYQKSVKGRERLRRYRSSNKYREYQRKYRLEHEYSKERKEELREYNKIYQKEYQKSDKYKDQQRRYYNSDKGKECRKRYCDSNRSRRRKYDRIYSRDRYRCDIQYRLKRILRGRLYRILNGRCKAGSAVRDLGCSISFLKGYLEGQFEVGMSWDNYGKGEGKWNIDHKYPLSKVDLTDREQFLRVCHYTNLQPLWELENSKKGNSEVGYSIDLD